MFTRNYPSSQAYKSVKNASVVSFIAYSFQKAIISKFAKIYNMQL